jgi:chemotaxis protein methyltransferase CheR
VLSRFEPLVKPGGLLFAGHSENFTYVTQAFRLRGQTVYELTRDAAQGMRPRVAQAPAAAAMPSPVRARAAGAESAYGDRG